MSVNITASTVDEDPPTGTTELQYLALNQCRQFRHYQRIKHQLITNAYALGISKARIAREMGIARTTVYDVLGKRK